MSKPEDRMNKPSLSRFGEITKALSEQGGYAPCPYPHEPGSKCPDRYPDEAEELARELLSLRDKLHSQHMLDKVEADRCEELIQLVCAALLRRHLVGERALRNLRAEVFGILELSREELRAVIGNTNMAVLQQRLDEAYAALPSPPAE